MAIQTNRTNNRTILIVGVVLAVAAAGLIFFVARGAGGNAATTRVVVASKPITAGAAITADQVEYADLSKDAVGNAFTDVALVQGQQTVNNIDVGTPIYPAMLATATTSPSGSAGLPVITPGYVALAIPVAITPVASPGSPVAITGTSADLLTVGGFIQTGDHVDILVENSVGTLRYGFQDVRILHGGSGGAPASVFIIELRRDQAELMTYMTTHTANAGAANATFVPFIVKYVLRPKLEYGVIGGTDPAKAYPHYELACSGPSAKPTDPCANPYGLISVQPGPNTPGIADTTVSAAQLQNLFR